MEHYSEGPKYERTRTVWRKKMQTKPHTLGLVLFSSAVTKVTNTNTLSCIHHTPMLYPCKFYPFHGLVHAISCTKEIVIPTATGFKTKQQNAPPLRRDIMGFIVINLDDDVNRMPASCIAVNWSHIDKW